MITEIEKCELYFIEISSKDSFWLLNSKWEKSHIFFRVFNSFFRPIFFSTKLTVSLKVWNLQIFGNNSGDSTELIKHVKHFNSELNSIEQPVFVSVVIVQVLWPKKDKSVTCNIYYNLIFVYYCLCPYWNDCGT